MKCNGIILVMVAAMCMLAAGCHSSRRVADVSAPAVHDTSIPSPPPPAMKPEAAVSERIVAEARTWLGTPYRYGGEERSGADCSGVVMKVYLAAAGVRLPRDSRSQRAFATVIDRDMLVPGDLLFFASKAGGEQVGHVGIYVGDDEFIHASSSRGVIVSRLGEPYYRRHYHSSGRVPGIKTAKDLKDLKDPKDFKDSNDSITTIVRNAF